MSRGPVYAHLAWAAVEHGSLPPEYLGAADIDLTKQEFDRIEAELAKIEVHGNRTDEDIAKLRDLH